MSRPAPSPRSFPVTTHENQNGSNGRLPEKRPSWIFGNCSRRAEILFPIRRNLNKIMLKSPSNEIASASETIYFWKTSSPRQHMDGRIHRPLSTVLHTFKIDSFPLNLLDKDGRDRFSFILVSSDSTPGRARECRHQQSAETRHPTPSCRARVAAPRPTRALPAPHTPARNTETPAADSSTPLFWVKPAPSFWRRLQ